MENYLLAENEVVLYEGTAKNKETKKKVNILLTNMFVVQIEKTKKLFSKEEVLVNAYSVNDIKIYNEQPQIKRKREDVKIFFKKEEKSFQFNSVQEATTFVSKINELLTGKTAFERGAEKTKQTVSVVDDALGISVVETTKNILEKGISGTILGAFKKKDKSPLPKNIKSLGVESSSNQEKKEISLEEQVSALKKFKELQDAGIITQEEFESKKREILKK